MKKLFLAITIIFSLLLSSCATFNPNVSSTNLNHTQVLLSSNNFQIIKRVQGTATAVYIFGIGGLMKKGLVASARAKLYEEANLSGSQIIISEHTEWKSSNIIPYVWGSATVTTSGYVVEFKDK
jgi:hypothetical protein